MTDFAFLHGGGQGSWVWQEAIAALHAKAGNAVRCLALDVPGCGVKRERDTTRIGITDIARELLSDIERAGFRDVVLVGHSQAGSVMPEMAALAPTLFRKLIYIAASAPLPGLTTQEMIGDGLQGERDDRVGWPVDPATHSMADRYRVMFCSDMDDAATDAFLAKMGHDMWPVGSYTHRDWRYDHLAAIPATFIVCTGDRSVPALWQERFAERFHATPVRLDVGHQAMTTRPDALADLLLAEAGGVDGLNMAKLYFYYASMNAGKSTTLLQADFNYRERGMETMLWTAALDDRSAPGAIASRIGLAAGAHRFTPETDLFTDIGNEMDARPLACVLIDEAQFLAPEQVRQLARLADEKGLPVLCYGLRTDFQGELFPGSAVLLGIADSLVELKAVCECGRKATMNLRVDGEGQAIRAGAQTEIGGNELYVALCRRHFMERLKGD